MSRGLGQSALSVASLALVGKWFGRGLNYAMGVYSLLVGIGFVIAFPSVGSVVLNLGWRTAWSGVGWVLLLAVAPIAWMVVRNGPEERGLQFDGDSPDAASSAVADFTLSEALRSSAFWLFALSSSMFGLVYSGISLFNQSILEQRGFDASVYHTVLVISTLLGLVANFGGGWLASRWSIQRLMGLGMAILGCALVCSASGSDLHSCGLLRCGDGDFRRCRHRGVLLCLGTGLWPASSSGRYRAVRK